MNLTARKSPGLCDKDRGSTSRQPRSHAWSAGGHSQASHATGFGSGYYATRTQRHHRARRRGVLSPRRGVSEAPTYGDDRVGASAARVWCLEGSASTAVVTIGPEVCGFDPDTLLSA